MSMTFGYLDMDTWVHRLDPRTKLMLLIVTGAVGFIVPHFGWIAMNLAMMLPFVFSARCARKWFILVSLASLPAWFIAAINMFWSNSVIPSGHVPGHLALDPIYKFVTGDPEPFLLLSTHFFNWEVMLTTLSFEKGLYFAFRWVNVVAPGVLFIYTTSPERFASSLSQLRLPYTIVFIMAAAVRFIPTIVNDGQTIYDAQRSRGAKIDGGFLPFRLARMSRLFFPLLILSLHHSYNLSIGMEARAFHTGVGRTRFYERQLATLDMAVICYGSLLIVSAFGARIYA